MAERYEKSYIAIPIKESPLADWIQNLNGEKKFLHMTFYFLGRIGKRKLLEIKDTVLKVSSNLSGVELKPKQLAIIGEGNKSFVVLLEETQKLKDARHIFETELSDFRDKNLPFSPHVTIKNLSFRDLSSGNFDKYMATPDKSKALDSFSATSIGVFYRTEDVTALLFSKKL